MDDAEIRDYLDGFMAWDHGCRSSGIKDDRKREEVQKLVRALHNTDPMGFRKLVWPILFRSVSPVGAYGIEDVQESLNWMRDFLGFDDWSGV